MQFEKITYGLEITFLLPIIRSKYDESDYLNLIGKLLSRAMIIRAKIVYQ